MKLRAAILVIAVAGLAACKGNPMGGGDTGEVPDSGPFHDAGPIPDAGVIDAGDSGPIDAGDSGPIDAGDSGPIDAGDSGPVDAGDSGPVDAGDSGMGDSGFDGGSDGSGDAGSDGGPGFCDGGILVSTFAGNGQLDSDGTGPTTTTTGTAEFDVPLDVAVDTHGNVYVADTENRIRKIDSNLNVTTVAGNGTYGFHDGTGGFNGTAEFAFSNSMYNIQVGIALDSSDNVYVADVYNNRIRKIDASGNVTTLAGSGTQGSMNGAAATAQFFDPEGVAVDSSGNVYVADTGNNCIRKIDTSGNVTTLAGSTTSGLMDSATAGGPALFNGPAGLAVDTSGNVYVADTYNARIRMVTPAGTVTTTAGSGSMGGFTDGDALTTAQFQQPQSVAVDSTGNVFVADLGNEAIREISSGMVVTVAGNGNIGYVNGLGGINGPAEFDFYSFLYDYGAGGVAVNASGDLFVADSGDNVIREIVPSTTGGAATVSNYDGTGSVSFADGTGGVTGTAEFQQPYGIAFDSSGNLYVADKGNNCIRKVDTSGNVTTLAGNGTRGSMDSTTNSEAEFYDPQGVAVDAQGNVYVADTGNSKVRVIAAAGGVTSLSPTFRAPTAIALDSQGNLYVGDTSWKITKITALGTGSASTFAGNGMSGSMNGSASAAEFSALTSIAFDSQNNMYVADGCQVRLISGGSVTTYAGSIACGDVDEDTGMSVTAKFRGMWGIAVDSGGNVYVGDLGNAKVRMIDTSGNVTTLAGTGSQGYLDGAGGESGVAKLNEPAGVTVNAQGVVFAADQEEGRIRMIGPGCP